MQAEIKTFRNNKRFSVEYDKFNDRSNAKFASFSIYSTVRGGGIIYFGLSFTFEGNKLKSNADKFNLTFWSSGSAWRFLKDHSLIFLLDDERFPYGEGVHDGRTTSNRIAIVAESVSFSITKEDVEKIANSKKTELQLGTFVGALTDEHKQMLKDMLVLSKLK